MTAPTIACGPRWPASRRPALTLTHCLLLAALLHGLAVVLIGSAPPGTARPSEGVWGALNVVLQAPMGDNRPGAATTSALQADAGPRGKAPGLRRGAGVRDAPPTPPNPSLPGAARLGTWNPATTDRAAGVNESERPPPAVLNPTPNPVASTELAPKADSAFSEMTAPAIAEPLPPAHLPLAPLPPLPPPSMQPTPLPTLPQQSAPPAAAQSPNQAAPVPMQTAETAPQRAPAPRVLRDASLPPPRNESVAAPAVSMRTSPTLVPPAPASVPAAPLHQAALPQTQPSVSVAVQPVPRPKAEPAVAPAAPALEVSAAPLAPAPSAPTAATRTDTATAATPASPNAAVVAPTPGPATRSETARPGVGAPDASPRLGQDVAAPPSAATSAPRLKLDLPGSRAGQISSQGSMGLLQLLPRPPETKSKLAQDIEKSVKPDCRKAYASMGLLAVLPLAADAVRDKGCRW